MEASNPLVEAATASLVREYLSRKGLKSTLEKMDIEYPRNELSINNRQLLMKHVRLEKIMKKNKEDREPFRSMLEVMTKCFMEGSNLESEKQNLNNKDTSISLRRQSSDIFVSPPLSQPVANTSKTNLASGDLIMDDDIDGECLTGGGKAGVFNVQTLVSPPIINSTKVSSKKADGVIKKNNPTASRSQTQTQKPMRLSVSQLEQQRKENKMLEKNGGTNISSRDDGTKDLDELSLDSLRLNSREPVRNKDNPVSFEALLMKGEERANLLKQIGLERKDVANNLTADQLYKVETSSIYKDRCKSASKNSSQTGASNSTKILDLELGDLDDMDMEAVNVKSPVILRPEKVTKLSSAPIDLRTAIALKNIILGSPTQLYRDEWLKQSFTFSQLKDIQYGIVQKKGGPCGVLAAVQGCFLQELLFGENKLPHNAFKNPSKTDRSKILAIALSNIFWRAGNYSTAYVTIPTMTTHLLNSTKFKQDGITERLSIYTFSNFNELSDFMIQSISEFETDGNPGVILTMYSAILSRKTHLTRADFDDPDHTTLIGNHGYCTQELVNLLLTGQAVSNVFNDIKQLDGCGIGDTIVLKGLSKRSDIGFLTLLEHYQSCEVGTFYKTPKNPVWIICSESHFSVLFATKQELVSDWRAERIFDLYYYDGLARQQEEIRLTINTLNPAFKAPKGNDDELIPPLEHCIRTKWTDAEIDWNGYEPIL